MIYDQHSFLAVSKTTFSYASDTNVIPYIIFPGNCKGQVLELRYCVETYVGRKRRRRKSKYLCNFTVLKYAAVKKEIALQ
jgi:hypothetical protein